MAVSAESGGVSAQGAYQSSEIVPNLRDVRVQADGTRVGVQSIPILIDLIVENTDGAPEGGIATVAVYGLLVGLICLGVFLLRHVATTQKVPTLRIVVVFFRQRGSQRGGGGEKNSPELTDFSRYSMARS